MKMTTWQRAAGLLLVGAVGATAGCGSDQSITAADGPLGGAAKAAATKPAPTTEVAIDATGKLPGRLVLGSGAKREDGPPTKGTVKIPKDIAAVRAIGSATRALRSSKDPSTRPGLEKAVSDKTAAAEANSTPANSTSVRVFRSDKKVTDTTGETTVDAFDVTITEGDLYTPDLIAAIVDSDPTQKATTVRGKPAVQTTPGEFGVAVGWQERPGLAVYVSLKSGNLDDLLQAVAAMKF